MTNILITLQRGVSDFSSHSSVCDFDDDNSNNSSKYQAVTTSQALTYHETYSVIFPILFTGFNESPFSQTAVPGELADTQKAGPHPRISDSLLGCCPRTGIFNKFPNDADVTGLRSTELEQHLLLAHRSRKLDIMFIFNVNLGLWVLRSEEAHSPTPTGRSESFIDLEGGWDLAPAVTEVCGQPL